jgi:hypothetical protein
MHIGIDETQPAIDLGATFGRTVASESRVLMCVGEVVQNRRVLCQYPAVFLEHRHLAVRIKPQIVVRLHIVVIEFFSLVRLADPLQHDVIGQRAGAGHVIQFHDVVSLC